MQLRKCPSLHPMIDMSVLRSARKRLDDYFPDIEHLRHAIAHKGENEAHPEVHAPDGQYAFAGFRETDVFSAPYAGRLCKLEISNRSLARITEVVGDFLSAFDAAASGLEREGHLA